MFSVEHRTNARHTNLAAIYNFHANFYRLCETWSIYLRGWRRIFGLQKFLSEISLSQRRYVICWCELCSIFFYCQLNPLWVFALLTIFVHSTLSLAIPFHFRTLITFRALSTLSLHLFLDLSFILLTSSEVLFTILISCKRAINPVHLVRSD